MLTGAALLGEGAGQAAASAAKRNGRDNCIILKVEKEWWIGKQNITQKVMLETNGRALNASSRR